VADVAAQLGKLALTEVANGRLDYEIGTVKLRVAAVVLKCGGE
jgi:hypothetical protein